MGTTVEGAIDLGVSIFVGVGGTGVNVVVGIGVFIGAGSTAGAHETRTIARTIISNLFISRLGYQKSRLL